MNLRRLLAVAGIAVISAACASTPANKATAGADPREKDPKFRYGQNPGPSPVGAIPDVLLNDSARNRDVKLNIDYPTRPGPHPLIVFSHGGGLSNRSYPGLAAHWASYGYVVIRPAHIDGPLIDDMTVALWRERVRDITFILDNLAALAQRYPELEGKVDTSKIAVAGHSRGAVTAMMLGGFRSFPGAVSYADPRIKAVAAFSPVGPREQWGFTPESFATLTLPVLYVTGSRDKGASEAETPEWREEAFALSPAGDKWLVTIEGVSAVTFTGQLGPVQESRTVIPAIVASPRADPRDVERDRQSQSEAGRIRAAGIGERMLFGKIRALTLAFFDTYLKGDTGGREYLLQEDDRQRVVVKTR